jgi:hypothetical protein
LHPLDQRDLPPDQAPPDEFCKRELPGRPQTFCTGEIWKWMKEHANSGSLPYVFFERGFTFDEYLHLNDTLWQLRRYMLIIKSDALPPPNAYVVHFDRGFWYYIAGDDTISQRNFNLISLFMTVMAIPSTTLPLTTSITVGGS